MNANKLYNAVGEIDDDILIDTEQYIFGQKNQLRSAHKMNVISSRARHSRSRRFFRTVAAILAAALVLVSSAGVAMAMNPEFRAAVLQFIFASRAGEILTPDQHQFIDENAVGIGQSITADGYTVTIDSAICDAYNLYLVIIVEGPEGVKVDPASEGGSLFFDQVKCESTGPYDRTGYLLSKSRSWSTLDDGDGRENTVTLVMKESYVMSADNDGVYTDGEVWRLQLADLTLRTGELYDKETILAEGGWSFEFPLTEASESIELISSPVVCLVQGGGLNGANEAVEVIVDSVVLTPFGAVCGYSLPPGSTPEAVELLDVYLVMKDGNVIQAQPKSGGIGDAGGSYKGHMSYSFDAPIILDDVGYLLLPDNVHIPIPDSEVSVAMQ